MTKTFEHDSESLVLAERDDDGVLRLTLNAPRSRNALSEAMMTALSTALSDAAVICLR